MVSVNWLSHVRIKRYTKVISRVHNIGHHLKSKRGDVNELVIVDHATKD